MLLFKTLTTCKSSLTLSGRFKMKSDSKTTLFLAVLLLLSAPAFADTGKPTLREKFSACGDVLKDKTFRSDEVAFCKHWHEEEIVELQKDQADRMDEIGRAVHKWDEDIVRKMMEEQKP
jgi:hypothetical protein